MDCDDSSHAFPYFPDGNVVLAAENADHKLRHFRVHRSILALHSPVFADIFTMPVQPEAEQYDGVPLVRLSDQSEDVSEFLKSFYGPCTLLPRHRDPNTPLIVRGVLELATKYQVDVLRTHIVQRIEEDWPQSLAEWEAAETEFHRIFNEFMATGPDDPEGAWLEEMFPEPASAIRLARDYDIPNILPAAFYAMSRLSPEEDWDASRAVDRDRLLIVGERSARWSLLHNQDLLALIRGNKLIGSAVARMHTRIFETVDEADCHGGPLCIAARKRFCGLFESAGHQDPLYELRGFYSGEQFGLRDVCESCRSQLLSEAQVRKQAIWDLLPDYFGLLDD
ncbi:hypothetical protein JAAARDRAFT_262371 [Jaapia argillacea MUCL 33604]|uniref:BTB domain-containing protein n=1 Tax=Jaapia argillacea MUCL 33604 TaxID=933084 RepID=A0A067PTY8_9AGAM|nr:hypothetical protein JAAARDRAFT_262371 [Jaapia argillacea MUCL 33604]